MELFQHRQIDRDKNEIRLLRILKSEPGTDDLKCRIYNAPLENCHPYAAISYTWGDDARTKTMTLNGCRFEVRENLYELLLQLRRHQVAGDKSQPSCFWIDGVCIDQSRIPERNHQVGMMQGIYSQAKTVLVWLGMGDASSRLAMSYLGGMERARLTPEGLPISGQVVDKPSWPPSGVHVIGTPGFVYWGDPCLSETMTAGKQEALRTIFVRPWWERMWIIQEVLVASEVRIMCGTDRIEWIKVQNLFEALTARSCLDPEDSWLYRVLPITARRLIRRKMMYDYERANNLGTPGPLLHELILDFSSHEASDPRDKIYALAGLAKSAPPIDYSKTASQVFVDALRCAAMSIAEKTGTVLGVQIRRQVDEIAEVLLRSLSLEAHGRVLDVSSVIDQVVHTLFTALLLRPVLEERRQKLEECEREIEERRRVIEGGRHSAEREPEWGWQRLRETEDSLQKLEGMRGDFELAKKWLREKEDELVSVSRFRIVPRNKGTTQ